MTEEKNPFDVQNNNPSEPKQETKPAINEDVLELIQKVPEKYLKKEFLFGGAFALLIVGIMLGAMFFGGDEVVQSGSGLQGVVANPEVPGGRKRCGMAEFGTGCVLYIVNSKHREIEAKELFPLAAQMTNIQPYVIDASNLHYGNVTIKPGYIAQINVKPIR